MTPNIPIIEFRLDNEDISLEEMFSKLKHKTKTG